MPVELEFQAVVNYLASELGTELRSSIVVVVFSLNCWSSSLQLHPLIFKSFVLKFLFIIIMCECVCYGVGSLHLKI